jgi:hypothetical protein
MNTDTPSVINETENIHLLDTSLQNNLNINAVTSEDVKTTTVDKNSHVDIYDSGDDSEDDSEDDSGDDSGDDSEDISDESSSEKTEVDSSPEFYLPTDNLKMYIETLKFNVSNVKDHIVTYLTEGKSADLQLYLMTITSKKLAESDQKVITEITCLNAAIIDEDIQTDAAAFTHLKFMRWMQQNNSSQNNPILCKYLDQCEQLMKSVNDDTEDELECDFIEEMLGLFCVGLSPWIECVANYCANYFE